MFLSFSFSQPTVYSANKLSSLFSQMKDLQML